MLKKERLCTFSKRLYFVPKHLNSNQLSWQFFKALNFNNCLFLKNPYHAGFHPLLKRPFKKKPRKSKHHKLVRSPHMYCQYEETILPLQQAKSLYTVTGMCHYPNTVHTSAKLISF